MASSKDLKPLIKRAKKAGWTVEPGRKSSHLKWVRPAGGMPYFSSSTPSDGRAVHNIESDLVKMGLPKAG
jgi:hypothetical protein